MITRRQDVVDRLAAFLHGRTDLSLLVDWAERLMMDGDFESDAVRDVVARLGVADVRAFGLTWEDCQRLLSQLGFAADIQIVSA